MNTNQVITKCNSCQAVIPSPGQQGAVRLPGTNAIGWIDFCESCSNMSISQVAAKFTVPERPQPQRVKLPNGTTTMLPPGARLPAGATVVPQTQT